MFAFVVFVSVF